MSDRGTRDTQLPKAGGAGGTTPLAGELARLDQRETAFYRHKSGPFRGTAAAATAEGEVAGRQDTSAAADAGSERGDPFGRVFFGEARRANCLNELYASAVDAPINPERTGFASPVAAREHVIEVARFLGADLAGVAPLDQAFVYTHSGHENGAASALAGRPIELQHHFAISIAVAMDYRRIAASPSFIDSAEVGRGYVLAGAAAVSLAAYIRELGWAARAHTVRNEQVLQIPLAVLAGLGELARNGLLITARYGPRVRLATVTTDLPLAVDHPADLGARRLCTVCRKCAACCPSRSIPDGPRLPVRGALKWAVNGDTCLAFWGSAPKRWSNCSVCIKVCPWNKPDAWWHAAAAGVLRAVPAAARPLVWLDDLLYGRNPRPHVRWLGYDNREGQDVAGGES